MPHLSPMSWIMFMPLLWVLLMLSMTTTFFMQAPTFNTTNMKSKSMSQRGWKWSL